MMGRILSDQNRSNSLSDESQLKEQGIHQAQEVIYQFLIRSVNQATPETVLMEFKQLFGMGENLVDPDVNQALHQIVNSKNEEEFRNTLKRACYILINNWSSKRTAQPIKELIQILAEVPIEQPTLAPTLNRIRTFISNFITSQDYQELKLFASPDNPDAKRHWTERYTSYLLVPQYLDSRNPIEQREIAKNLSKRLKKQFKLELAMYTARCDSPTFQDGRIPNPTRLGDKAIRLIKKVSAQHLSFSYVKHAAHFLQQVKTINYIEFKEKIHKYLIFSGNQNSSLKLLDDQLNPKLNHLYANHESKPLTTELLLRTCRRLIEFLTTEDGQEPSPLFILLTTQGSPLTIVITLLKIILICKNAQTHLEVCIAKLILYYENSGEKECKWLIEFLEIFNIVFTIYNEDIQYNLIKIHTQDKDSENPYLIDLDAYRVFSQLKGADLRAADLSGLDIRNSDLIAADLRDADLCGTDLSHADLSLAKLTSAKLIGATLNHTEFSSAMLNSADLSSASLRNADLRCANLRLANLNSANLTAAKMRRADIQRADLSYSHLTHASMKACDLRGANLDHADLSHVNLCYANLCYANLSHANLRSAELRRSKLHHANLSEANLDRANLTYASLKGTNLSGADLTRVDLSGGNLSDADLSNALLRHVNLNGTNLSNANLSGANLFGTNLSRAKVKGTYFSKNSGLSEEMKLELEQQGAIIEEESDTIEDSF